MGELNELVVTHEQFRRVGVDDQACNVAYRALFKSHISERALHEIRDSTNKAWLLGSDYFTERIESKLNRRTTPLVKVGDLRSEEYREKQYQSNLTP